MVNTYNIILYSTNSTSGESSVTQQSSAPHFKTRHIGNVHTGAVPPWLRDDEEEEEKKGVTIGPSEEEFWKWSKPILLC